MLPKKSAHLEKNHYSKSEEWMNSLSHGLGFLFAAFGLYLLLAKAEGLGETVSSWVYGLSLCGMFLSSTIYHACVSIKWRARLRKVDHIAIYLLIAGSYTPFLLLSIGDRLGYIGLVVIWAIGIAGILFKLFAGHKYPKLSISTYAAMGWMALFLIYPIYQNIESSGVYLLLGGGLCYSAGIPLYLLKSRHYSHALWHVAVTAGAALHFFAIYNYVL